ncbi:hypothetical protein [Emticicia sp.]|uniref:hypothetical protein n=1 Tax=Emticicia sp. TaxID=1930953 RepID=UPI003751F99B
MRKISFVLLLVLSACQSNKTETADSKTMSSVDTVATATKPVIMEQTLCFEQKLNKDITTVKLIINGDAVSGEMNWTPWEKDGASGTLKGKKIGDEIIADYDYMIEGSNQSEEKIFKLEGDKLLVKVGELMDGKDGKLIMKDPAKARFSETLIKVKCQ